jgi:hypothetical protein
MSKDKPAGVKHWAVRCTSYQGVNHRMVRYSLMKTRILPLQPLMTL